MPDAYLAAVAALPCVVCGAMPVQVHHASAGSMIGIESGGMGRKNGSDKALPLCLNHHTGAQGVHTIGVQTWEALYGPQSEMLEAVARRVGMARPEPRPSKIMARR